MSFLLYFCVAVLLIISVFLILLVLIQKGRGGGLASAFGGGGGNTAFGSKTGDVLTLDTASLAELKFQNTLQIVIKEKDITAAVVSPDGKSVAVVCKWEMKVIDVATSKANFACEFSSSWGYRDDFYKQETLKSLVSLSRRIGALVVSYRVTIAATALAHLALGTLVYSLAPGLEPALRLFGVMLLVVVSCTWMVMIYLGAAQDYASVVTAFFLGNAVSLLGALALGRYLGTGGYLAGFLVGQAGIFFVLCARVEREFSLVRVPEWVDLTRAFVHYPELIAAGLLYNAAIAVDRVVFWIGPTGHPIVGWFRASLYDSPIFLCYLSVVPALAILDLKPEAREAEPREEVPGDEVSRLTPRERPRCSPARRRRRPRHPDG